MAKSNKVASHLAKPYLQVHTAELTGWLGHLPGRNQGAAASHSPQCATQAEGGSGLVRPLANASLQQSLLG